MERGSILWPVVIGINAINLGFQGGMMLGRHEEHAEQRVETVQVLNEELRQQLEGSYRQIGNLILRDDNKSFTFVTREAGTQEDCTGRYQIKEGVARVSGNLTCSSTVKLNG